MKRVLGLTSMIAFIAVLAIGYSNATLYASGASEKLENVNLTVTGMSCSLCSVLKVESELSKLPEVKASEVDWKTGSVAVKVTPGSNHKALADAVKSAGFEVASAKCECPGG